MSGETGSVEDEGLIGELRIPTRVASFAAYCLALYAQYETVSRVRGAGQSASLRCATP